MFLKQIVIQHLQVLVESKNRLESCSLMGVDWGMVDIIDFYASSSFLAPLLVTLPKGNCVRLLSIEF